MAVAAGVGAYELALLAVAGITALFVGQKAAKSTADALERSREQPQTVPIDLPITTDCTAKPPEKCPICKRGANPTPGVLPPYCLSLPPRCPKDSETNPPLTLYKRTEVIIHRARVYEAPSGNFYYVDTNHKGTASELEVFDRRRRHLGTMCPHCGGMKPESQVKGRTLRR